MSIFLKIPTINDNLKDFDYLFKLDQEFQKKSSEIILDFSKCYFLRQNAVAFLGGLVRLAEYNSQKVIFKWETVHKDVLNNLKQNGFYYHFNAQEEPWSGNSIPFREDKFEKKDDLVNYLTNEWLGRGWVNISDLLMNLIVSRTWEIYANAFEHSQTKIGVFSCGQHYPKLGELKLTVIDFGVGIPENVRNFLKTPDLPADQCLKWAFSEGNTTRGGEITGGIGLDYLKQFVKVNQGKLEIFSLTGFVNIDKNQEIYENRDSFFQGTLVNITLKCDESYYSLVFESDDQPLF